MNKEKINSKKNTFCTGCSHQPVLKVGFARANLKRPKKTFCTGCSHQPVLKGVFCTGWWLQPVLKAVCIYTTAVSFFPTFSDSPHQLS